MVSDQVTDIITGSTRKEIKVLGFFVYSFLCYVVENNENQINK